MDTYHTHTLDRIKLYADVQGDDCLHTRAVIDYTLSVHSYIFITVSLITINFVDMYIYQ